MGRGAAVGALPWVTDHGRDPAVRPREGTSPWITPGSFEVLWAQPASLLGVGLSGIQFSLNGGVSWTAARRTPAGPSGTPACGQAPAATTLGLSSGRQQQPERRAAGLRDPGPTPTVSSTSGSPSATPLQVVAADGDLRLPAGSRSGERNSRASRPRRQLPPGQGVNGYLLMTPPLATRGLLNEPPSDRATTRILQWNGREKVERKVKYTRLA